MRKYREVSPQKLWLLCWAAIGSILLNSAISAAQFCELPTEQINGLQELFEQTNGTHWRWKDPNVFGPIWNFKFTEDTISICGTQSKLAWQGIVCSCDSGIGSVMSLNLGGYHLQGRIPNIFLPFSNLISLNLDTNKLYGTIPKSIVSLYSLQQLSLYQNSLTGTLPSFLGEIQNLTHLSVYSNQLVGDLPTSLGSLRSLTTLYLHDNLFSGTLPPVYGQLTSLQEIWLYLNNIGGTLPDSYSNMSSLTKLYINHNYLVGTIPESYIALRNLQVIDFAVNTLSGSLPYFLMSYPNLTSISLSSNCFDGSFPAGICDQKAGKNLNIIVMDGISSSTQCKGNSKLQKTKPFFIRGFLQSNTLEGTLPSCIWSLPSLESLHISGNGLRGQLYPIAENSPLQQMVVSHNLFVGTIPTSIQTHAFSVLDLSSNRLGGSLVSDFNIDYYQTYLRLSVNRISGVLPVSMTYTWPNLTTLDVLTSNRYLCPHGLPESDSRSKIYACGSNDLNTAVYSWMGFLFWLGIVILTCLFFANRTSNENFHVRASSIARLSMGSIFSVELSRKTKPKKEGKKNNYFRDFDIYDKCSRAVLFTLEWWKETSAVNLSSYESEMCTAKGSSIPQTILFLEFIRIVGYWSTLILFTILVIALPFNLYSNFNGFSSVSETYGYVISSVFIRGIVPVIYFAIFISLLLFKIKFDSNFHRIKAINYLSFRTLDSLPMTLGNYWASIVNSVIERTSKILDTNSDLETASNAPSQSTESSYKNSEPLNVRSVFQPKSKRTFKGTLALISLQLINILITGAVNIVYVESTTTNQLTSESYLALQFWIGFFKFAWSNTFIPWASTTLQQNLNLTPKSAMKQRYLMLVVNYLIAPCLASISSNQSCFYYIFRPFPQLTSSFYDTVCNYSFVKFSNSIVCVSSTQVNFSVAYRPPFFYSYNCGTALLVAYVPVLLYAYSISGMILPAIRLLLLRVPSLRRYILPLKFLRNLSNNKLLPNNDGRVVLDGKATIVTLMLHITVLLTFGVCYPMLGFAVAFTIFAETATHKLTMGKFLFITKLLNNRWKIEQEKILNLKSGDVESNKEPENAYDNKAPATPSIIELVQNNDVKNPILSEKQLHSKELFGISQTPVDTDSNASIKLDNNSSPPLNNFGHVALGRITETEIDEEEQIVDDFTFDSRLQDIDYATKVLEESNRDAWAGIHACIWYMIFSVCAFWALLFFDMATDQDEEINSGIEVVVIFSILLPSIIFVFGRIRYHPKVIRLFKHFMSGADPMRALDSNVVDHTNERETGQTNPRVLSSRLGSMSGDSLTSSNASTESQAKNKRVTSVKLVVNMIQHSLPFSDSLIPDNSQTIIAHNRLVPHTQTQPMENDSL